MHLGGFSVSSLILNQLSQHVLLQVGICWSLAKFHKTLFNNPFFSSVLPSQISQSLSQFWTGVDEGRGRQ